MEFGRTAGAGVCLLLLAVAAGRVAAQPRPCADEVKRLCPEVTPGRAAIAACLQPHFDELSPLCQKQLQRLQRRQKSIAGRRRHVQTVRASLGTPSPAPAATPTP